MSPREPNAGEATSDPAPERTVLPDEPAAEHGRGVLLTSLASWGRELSFSADGSGGEPTAPPATDT